MAFDWTVLWAYRADLLAGLHLTLFLSAVGILGSTILGVLVGCLGAAGKGKHRLVAAYVALMRNVPIIVKLFFAHFILGIDALPAGLVVLVIHQSAYIADVTAAGLRSVPVGQREAALASGLTDLQVFVAVLLPQAARAMIAPLTSQYAQVVKNSAVVMVVALQDLTFMAQRIEQATFRGVEAAAAVTLLYVAIAGSIAMAMSMVQRLLEPGEP